MKQLPMLIILVLLIGCQGGAPAVSANRRESARVQPEGRRVAMELQSQLRAGLMRGLETGGPEGGFEFCNQDQLSGIRELERAQPMKTSIKRLSRRSRNPANAPDAWEVLALAHFEGLRAPRRDGSAEWVQRVDDGGKLKYRYYQPILAGAPCLMCHGDPATFSDSLRHLLKSRYPQDPATGYQAGQLMGLLRIEFDGLPRTKE